MRKHAQQDRCAAGQPQRTGKHLQRRPQKRARRAYRLYHACRAKNHAPLAAQQVTAKGKILEKSIQFQTHAPVLRARALCVVKGAQRAHAAAVRVLQQPWRRTAVCLIQQLVEIPLQTVAQRVCGAAALQDAFHILDLLQKRVLHIFPFSAEFFHARRVY